MLTRGKAAGEHVSARERRKTRRRYNVPGEAHALTFSCFHRQAFLSRDRTRDWLLAAMDTARRRLRFDLWAYVIMPEHVHLLILPLDDPYSISRILSGIKTPVARRAVAYVRKHRPAGLGRMRDAQPNGKVSYRFWQRGGGYDRNLTAPSIIHAEIDYIHANPVRRGLVEHPADWPWSSARHFEGQSDVRLVPDVESIPDRRR